MNVNGKKKKNQVVTANIFEQQELLKKAEVIRANLTASTWRELETNGKFDKNKKLSFISDDMLTLGCDVGSEIHYMRAIVLFCKLKKTSYGILFHMYCCSN